LSVTMALA